MVPGVNLTVSTAAVGTTVEVTVAKDTDSVQDSVKAMVDGVNAILTQIDSLTSYNADTKTSGPLAGDASLRSLRNSLLNAVYPGDNTTMADVGLQTDRYGKLVFDADKFATAYAADPALVASKFTSGTVDGFAARVATIADKASDKYTGTITAAITGHTSEIKELQDNIDNWDTRLELRRTTLQNQFTALETAMNQMTSQSSWLAGQIKLPIRIIVKAKEGKNMMMTDARAAYMDASVATADPSRLLVMLCDRLVLDVQRALGAQVAGHHETAHHQLVHAQAIVTELRVSLDPDRLPGRRRARRPLRLPLPAADPRQHPPRLSGDRGVPADRHPGRRHLARGRPLARPYGGASMSAAMSSEGRDAAAGPQPGVGGRAGPARARGDPHRAAARAR